ncbi:hypothetical protein HHI36_019853 [Cryptolaemus montrouzieri]|uniref:Uncharacterized protein n=1 Tax=Cryptolaemus montrouzieri TaxID=559131 RepID=A0ABD2NA26_9CUCU
MIVQTVATKKDEPESRVTVMIKSPYLNYSSDSFKIEEDMQEYVKRWRNTLEHKRMQLHRKPIEQLPGATVVLIRLLLGTVMGLLTDVFLSTVPPNITDIKSGGVGTEDKGGK